MTLRLSYLESIFVHTLNFSGGSKKFQKWGATDCLRGDRSNYARVILYITNQIF